MINIAENNNIMKCIFMSNVFPFSNCEVSYSPCTSDERALGREGRSQLRNLKPTYLCRGLNKCVCTVPLPCPDDFTQTIYIKKNLYFREYIFAECICPVYLCSWDRVFLCSLGYPQAHREPRLVQTKVPRQKLYPVKGFPRLINFCDLRQEV